MQGNNRREATLGNAAKTNECCCAITDCVCLAREDSVCLFGVLKACKCNGIHDFTVLKWMYMSEESNQDFDK